MDPRMFEYRRERRNFAVKAYSIAFLFTFITFCLWLIFLMVPEIVGFNLQYYFFSLILLIIALLLIILFVFWEKVRFTLPLNWIAALAIVLFFTAGLGLPVVVGSWVYYLVSCLIDVVLIIVFVIIGVASSTDLTLEVVVIFVTSALLFTAAFVFLLFYIIASAKFGLFVFCIFILLIILMFVMYHAQTINGGRYAEMRSDDYLLAGLIIYNDFVLILMIFMLIQYGIFEIVYRNHAYVLLQQLLDYQSMNNTNSSTAEPT